MTPIRPDETSRHRLLMFLLSPLAGLWRLTVLRPLYRYATATCRQVGTRGARDRVEVRTAPAR
ncbi:hypothetical protein [Streptomyces sp. WG7]|uniref:hypothetical protein n=1 Tax=Streptomyces sp. WG7 TaxID=3417650 RepID=UPI003CF513EA